METTEALQELDPAEAARQQGALAAMEEAGVSITDSTQVDYFGFEETEDVYLPDGRSFVTIRGLNEGARRKYLNAVNREVKLQKVTGDAILKMATGEERHVLLSAAICGWNLQARNPKTGQLEPVPFTDQKKAAFLEAANPKVIDLIEKAVRKANEWLGADISIEDIDAQIKELQEMRERKVEEAEGKGV